MGALNSPHKWNYRSYNNHHRLRKENKTFFFNTNILIVEITSVSFSSSSSPVRRRGLFFYFFILWCSLKKINNLLMFVFLFIYVLIFFWYLSTRCQVVYHERKLFDLSPAYKNHLFAYISERIPQSRGSVMSYYNDRHIEVSMSNKFSSSSPLPPSPFHK